MYGWKKEHVLGQVVYTFLQTEFPRPKAEILETFLREGRWEGELIHTCVDGRRVTVSSRWTLERDASGAAKSYLEINTDITQRKQLEVERARYLENVSEAVSRLATTSTEILATPSSRPPAPRSRPPPSPRP